MILGRTERFVGFVQLVSGGDDGLDRRDRPAPRAHRASGPVRSVLVRDAARRPPPVRDGAQRPRLRVVPGLLRLLPVHVAPGLAGTRLAGTRACDRDEDHCAPWRLPVLCARGRVPLIPRRRFGRGSVLVGAGGLVLGSYWYLVNIVRRRASSTGRSQTRQTPPRWSTGAPYSFLGTIAHFLRLRPSTPSTRRARFGRDRFVLPRRGSRHPRPRVAGPRTRREHGLVAAGAALVAVCVTWRWIDHELLLMCTRSASSSSTGATLAFLGFDKDLTRASPFQSLVRAARVHPGRRGSSCFFRVAPSTATASAAARRVGLSRARAGDSGLVLQAVTTFYSTIFDGPLRRVRGRPRRVPGVVGGSGRSCGRRGERAATYGTPSGQPARYAGRFVGLWLSL